jgi:hypothetical protein
MTFWVFLAFKCQLIAIFKLVTEKHGAVTEL